jgi:hypothetical protein
VAYVPISQISIFRKFLFYLRPQNPLYHPPAGKTSIWDGTIHFAGTETADQHGGYLEGALTAADRAVMNH